MQTGALGLATQGARPSLHCAAPPASNNGAPPAPAQLFDSIGWSCSAQMSFPPETYSGLLTGTHTASAAPGTAVVQATTQAPVCHSAPEIGASAFGVPLNWVTEDGINDVHDCSTPDMLTSTGNGACRPWADHCPAHRVVMVWGVDAGAGVAVTTAGRAVGVGVRETTTIVVDPQPVSASTALAETVHDHMRFTLRTPTGYRKSSLDHHVASSRCPFEHDGAMHQLHAPILRSCPPHARTDNATSL